MNKKNHGEGTIHRTLSQEPRRQECRVMGTNFCGSIPPELTLVARHIRPRSPGQVKKRLGG